MDNLSAVVSGASDHLTRISIELYYAHLELANACSSEQADEIVNIALQLHDIQGQIDDLLARLRRLSAAPTFSMC